MRPIDNLHMILRDLQRNQTLNDFNDFVGCYGLKETCSMLVQMLTHKEGIYLVSQRVEDLVQIRNRIYVDNVNRSPNVRGVQATQSASLFDRRNLIRQSPLNFASQQATGVNYYQSEEALYKLYAFDFDRPELFSYQASREVCERAWQLLLSNECGNKIEESEMQTHRHLALFIYLGRLLRPIWKLSAFTRPSITSMKDVRSNYDKMMPARDRISQLKYFIESNIPDLYGFSGKLSPEQAAIQDELSASEKVTLDQLQYFLERCLDVFEFM
jgi:hypothetical protein